jgi:hypothetical protein
MTGQKNPRIGPNQGSEYRAGPEERGPDGTRTTGLWNGDFPFRSANTAPILPLPSTSEAEMVS